MSDYPRNPAIVPATPIVKQSVASSDRISFRILDGWTLALAALVVCWISFFMELSDEWKVNPQYGYGFAVPFVGAALVWRRFQKRPAPSPSKSLFPGFVAAALLFSLLPLDLILEANPEWRLLYWFHGLLVLVLSFSFVYRAGGWTWVKYFAAPLAFMLIAVPWPMQLEQAVVQSLMRFVASLTVAVVGVFGIPAVQHGNLIEVSNGVVGINEACSGVRSLQTALMLSLFLGELYLFSRGRRLVLLGASLVTVLLANVVRTSYLTRTAAISGLKQMESVHDFAGMMVMIIVLPTLFLLAFWMARKHIEASHESTSHPSLTQTMPRWVAVSALAWILASWALTQAWYRSHETHLIYGPHWAVAWPIHAPGFKGTEVPQESLAILRCSDSQAAAWQDAGENDWRAFFLRWNPGKNSAQLAFGHRPDICFPASGAELLKNYGYIPVDANGVHLQFRYLTFQMGPRLLHVFYCLWSDCSSPDKETVPEDGSWKSRLQAVRAGRRNLGQQVLEVVLAGPDDSSKAIALLKQQLPQLISTSTGKAASD
ncbi:MAG TPA: exosortase/archaeosortase family protein [Verrucomicrobiae bacterium]|jgi:exosortase|nr:exosortase/archaeosortase family protein [Verrucomicrobiae bacterium]